MPVEPKSLAKQTVVEDGTELKGKLTSLCPVVINGVVDGELNAPEVTVASTGAVSGAIKAKRLRSQGTLSGSVVNLTSGRGALRSCGVVVILEGSVVVWLDDKIIFSESEGFQRLIFLNDFRTDGAVLGRTLQQGKRIF